MRTTLNIDDDLLRRAKIQASSERTTLTKLIEQGLRLRLESSVATDRDRVIELPKPIPGLGELRPEARGIISYSALLDLMESDDE